jgi:hypothetical protein
MAAWVKETNITMAEFARSLLIVPDRPVVDGAGWNEMGIDQCASGRAGD